MLDVYRLRLLRELDRRGTLAAVARALSYSPSAISQQLSQLETETGVTLLEPVGRGVRLTPLARILVTHTEAILERLEEAEAELRAAVDRGARHPAGRLVPVGAVRADPVGADPAGRAAPGAAARDHPRAGDPGVRGAARARVRPRARRGVPRGRAAAGGRRRAPSCWRETSSSWCCRRTARTRSTPARRPRPFRLADLAGVPWILDPPDRARARGRATPAGRRGSSPTSATRAPTCCSRSCWRSGGTPPRSSRGCCFRPCPGPPPAFSASPAARTAGSPPASGRARPGQPGHPRAARGAAAGGPRGGPAGGAGRGVSPAGSRALSRGRSGCRPGPARCGRRAARGPRRGARRGSRSR